MELIYFKKSLPEEAGRDWGRCRRPPLFGFKKRSCPWPGHQQEAITKKLAQGQLNDCFLVSGGVGLVPEEPDLRDEVVAFVQAVADEGAKNRLHFVDTLKVFICA